MPLPKRNQSRGLWVGALLATLLLHASVWLGLLVLQPVLTGAQEPRPSEPIELVMVDPGKPSPPKQPTAFTELPPDRADQAPERADFLSNVTSRARDRVPGGNDALPRMNGESEFPSVEMKPEGGSPGTPRPEDAASGDAETETQGSSAAADAAGITTAAARRAREQSGLLVPGAMGASDILQPEMQNPGGNAELLGDISLNTLEWDFAPWLQRFRRELMRRWYAPTAYYMGMLKEGGWALVEMEVSPSGEMLRLDLLGDEGHPSLTQASLEALRSTAPLERLPDHFPEPTLILRIRMIYPKVRTR